MYALDVVIDVLFLKFSLDLDRFNAPLLGEFFLLIPEIPLSLFGTLFEKNLVGGVVHCPFIAVLFRLPLGSP